ncbi:Spc19-domain-containing protein [Pisolithus marmoratus]|nr:Spc19-domain-containing protein [Pisolithus marmoratus]
MKSRSSTLSRPRESIFTGGLDIRNDANAVCPPNVRECVFAMEDCCEEAYEAQQLLRNGTFDLPRMNKVLDSQRVFLLIDEATVRRYRSDLADEIEPQINELIDRAEQGLKLLRRKEGLMHSKVEAANVMQSRAATAPTANKREERRAQLLSKQRRRLEEEVKVLESEIMALVGHVELGNVLIGTYVSYQ